MESKKIYEDSYDELVRIKKSIASESFTINAGQLDGNTRDQLLTAINKVINTRSKEIQDVIFGLN